MDRRPLAVALAVALLSQFVNVAPSTAASPYLLPVPAGLKVQVFQGNSSQFNHSAGSKAQFAWDFVDGAVEFPVVAARAGKVIGARSDSTNTNCHDVSCWTDANYVLIDHGDGTSALYLHLKTGSVTVKPGPQTIPQGTFLGNADSTGWSEGTHLHFMVETTPTSRTADGWWWGWSKEITFADAGLPLVDQYYVSQNAGGASTGPTPTPTPTPSPTATPTPTAPPTKPAAPTSVHVVDLGNYVDPCPGYVWCETWRITWHDASNNELGFRIYFSEPGHPQAYVGRVGKGVTRFDYDFQGGTSETPCFWVAAYNAVGMSKQIQAVGSCSVGY